MRHFQQERGRGSPGGNESGPVKRILHLLSPGLFLGMKRKADFSRPFMHARRRYGTLTDRHSLFRHRRRRTIYLSRWNALSLNRLRQKTEGRFADFSGSAQIRDEIRDGVYSRARDTRN